MENEAQLRLDEGLEQDNSDSVNDSQTGDPSIKEALFNLNENMGKMAGLLENVYNRPCSEDCDRPPGSKRRRRSRSPDTRSADEDEPRGKRRCNRAEDVDNEDRLSVLTLLAILTVIYVCLQGNMMHSQRSTTMAS